MVQTVCLDESKHAMNMLRELKQMKQEENHCDFTVRVGVDICRTHMNVVAAGSPYFKAMLKHNTKERQDREVVMKDVDFECVKICIDFMYTGNFDIPDGKTSNLMYVAMMMQLDDVTKALYDIIVKSLCVASFFETKQLAMVFDYHELSTACKAFFEENLLEISALPGFEEEEKTEIVSILRSTFPTEEEKLTVTLRWIAEDPEKVAKISELIKLIRLEEISPQYLSNLLENHALISNNFELYKLINGASVKRMRMAETSSSSSKSRRKVTMTGLNEYESGTMILFDKITDSMLTYNPVSNALTKCHNEKFLEFKKFTAVILEQHIYLLSGLIVYRLDFRNRAAKWQQLSPMNNPHGLRPSAVVFQRSIIVVGSELSNPTKSVERYYPNPDKWWRETYKPDGVGAAALVSLGDSVYCVGGKLKGNFLNTFCKFHPTSASWTSLAPLRSSRLDCSAVTTGQNIIVIGGRRNDYDLVTDVECYDVNTAQWSLLAPMMQGHDRSIAHYASGWIWVYSFSNDDFTNSVDIYDVENNVWHKDRFETDNDKYVDVYCIVPASGST